MAQSLQGYCKSWKDESENFNCPFKLIELYGTSGQDRKA
jgi:hypothetical protein